MHYGIAEKNIHGGYSLYNQHDDEQHPEFIGTYTDGDEIQYERCWNDDIYCMALEEALRQMNRFDLIDKIEHYLKEKRNPSSMPKNPSCQEIRGNSSKIFYDNNIENVIYKELENFLTYEYAADIFMSENEHGISFSQEVLAELQNLLQLGYEWFSVGTIHRVLGMVFVRRMHIKM